MRCTFPLIAAVALALAAPGRAGTRASDELFWVPTIDQALAMAQETGRPIFLTFYTCVGEKSETYSGRSTVW